MKMRDVVIGKNHTRSAREDTILAIFHRLDCSWVKKSISDQVEKTSKPSDAALRFHGQQAGTVNTASVGRSWSLPILSQAR